MRLTKWGLAGLTLITGVFATGSAGAQQATVFVKHAPGRTATSQVTHQLPGQDESSRRRGVPRSLEVPEGGQACYVIEGANPVLYQYAVGSKVVVIDAPAEVSTIQSALGLLASASMSGMLGFSGATTDQNKQAQQEQVRIGQYAMISGEVHRLYLRLKAARLQSDVEPDFTITARRIAVLADSAVAANARADTMYRTFWPDGTSSPPVVVLRTAQIDAATAAKSVGDQFRSALALLEEPLCINVDNQRRAMFLSIKPAPNGPAKLERAVGDTLVRVEVEPTSTRAIEVGAGYLVGAFADGARSFYVDEGRVYGRAEERVSYQPSVFLLGRAWNQDWLWGTIGASVSDEGLSAMFLGLTGRFGPSVVGTRFNLGLGLSLTRVPVRLKGFSEGDEFPSDAGDLSDLIESEIRPGLGVTIMLSGN